MNPKIPCKHCGKLITKNNIERHENSCLKNQEESQRKAVLEEWITPEGKYKCPYCGKEYTKNGIGTHIWRSHTEAGKKQDPNIGYKTGDRQAWNKGLTKDSDYRIKLQGEAFSKGYRDGKYPNLGFANPNFVPTEKMIEARKHYGGYRPGAGRSKKTRYTDSFNNSVLLQSSFELRCAQILDSMSIRWIRPEALYYDGNRRYYGDFYLVDYNVYLDPKNPYKAKLDREKIEKVIEQNNVNLYILLEQDLNSDKISDIISR